MASRFMALDDDSIVTEKEKKMEINLLRTYIEDKNQSRVYCGERCC